MSDQGELAFPVNYADDFQPPLEDYLPRVPTLPIPVPPPPKKAPVEDTTLTGAISITIKSTKPAWTTSLSVHQPTRYPLSKPLSPPSQVLHPPTLNVSSSKAKPGRYKLLKEYDIKDGDTVNLMVRAGSLWDPSQLAPTLTSSPGASGTSTPAITTTDAPATDPESITLVPEQTKQTRSGHARIPSVVLSPSPSLTPVADEKLVDIPLVLDTSNMPPSSLHPGPNTPYHAKIAQADFWQRLHTFLNGEFESESDAAQAWEDFFCASKGTLSVSEIAKIRDTVGVLGMAGS
ncbi:hypothetical protein BC629DRAFT_1597059 [Irpex lacteus]|nr:hypothetical protein BC629DRAFT_1597059 [Irpex lacteus]